MFNSLLTGLPVNATWDLLKYLWSKLADNRIESLLLRAFDKAIESQKQQLQKLGQPLDGVLNAEVAISLNIEGFSQWVFRQNYFPVGSCQSDSDFIEALIDIIDTHELLEIGGHALNPQDYRSRVSTIVRAAISIFKADILSDAKPIQQSLVHAIDNNQRQLDEIRRFLSAQGYQLGQLVDGQQLILAKLDDIAALQIEGSTISTQDVENKVLQQQIEDARELQTSGQLRAALAQYEKLDSKAKTIEAPNNARFQIKVNIGACQFNLGNHSEASDYFYQAWELNRTDVTALAYKGLSETIKHDYDKAARSLDMALEMEPLNTKAISYRLNLYLHTQTIDQIPADLIEHAQTNSETREALAHVKMAKGQWQLALDLISEVARSTESSTRTRILYARLLILIVQENLIQNGTELWRANTQQDAQLTEAKDTLDKAISELSRTEQTYVLIEALNARAGAHSITGDWNATLNDCKQVLLFDDSNLLATRNAGLAHIHIQEPDNAIPYLERVIEHSPIIDYEIFLARATIHLNQAEYANVVSLLTTQFEDGRLEIERLKYLGVSYAHLKVDEKLRQTIDTLNQNPNGASRIAVATIEATQGNVDKAEEIILEACDQVRPDERSYVLLVSAYFLFDIAQQNNSVDKFRAASKIFRKLDLPPEPIEATRKYLIALYNSRQLDAAFSLAQRVRNNGAAIPLFSEIEARLLAETHDLDGAITLHKALSVASPHNPAHRIDTAQLLIQQELYDDAIEILEQATKQFSKHPYLLINAANLLSKTHYPQSKIVDLAYRARQLANDSAEIHQRYAWLALKFKDDTSPEVDTVQVDTAVFLETEGHRRWYYICDHSPCLGDAGELHVSEKLAQKLLGAREGDTIVISDHGIRKVKGKIHAVVHKYNAAVRETFEQFPYRFPDVPGPISMPINLDNQEHPLHITLPSPPPYEDVLITPYHQGQPFTIDIIASMMKRDFIPTYEYLRMSAAGLRAINGYRNELLYQIQLLSSQSSVTVDLSVLLTLFQTDSLTQLSTLFETIYVPRSTLIELDKTIEYLQDLSDSPGSVGFDENGAMRFTPVSTEERQNHIENVKKIKRFIKEQATFAPIPDKLRIMSSFPDDVQLMLDGCQMDAALLSLETSTVLLCDDLHIRVYITDPDFKTACTQAVFYKLLQERIDDFEAYYQRVRWLSDLNYRRVVVDEELLEYALIASNWELNDSILRLYDSLADPQMDIRYASLVLAKLLHNIFTGNHAVERRRFVLDLILNILTKKRNRWPTVKLFIESIAPLISMAPTYQTEIVQYTLEWLNLREFSERKPHWLL